MNYSDEKGKRNDATHAAALQGDKSTRIAFLNPQRKDNEYCDSLHQQYNEQDESSQ